MASFSGICKQRPGCVLEMGEPPDFGILGLAHITMPCLIKSYKHIVHHQNSISEILLQVVFRLVFYIKLFRSPFALSILLLLKADLFRASP